jgi:hypothetical protein
MNLIVPSSEVPRPGGGDPGATSGDSRWNHTIMMMNFKLKPKGPFILLCRIMLRLERLFARMAGRT